ncbi:indole-3-glycerol phosphate synthase TrpC [Enterocloster clostridioformis]|uniref:Indole-3-glycerol phosphate synthase n=1 Tax=Enterocloster clostridioformis TaxID=1531 RepID=A0ABD6LCM7_9FIRM|nr:indole-3-glycerol phosphate synthase TrpC [Enterocloster clostridioformis]NSJ42246.1 indole-3-glycerol phosphate synthase TrpC [Enterocloster clostridioformis]
MILDTIARSAGKRVEQRKQVKSLEQMMKAACECREREGIKGDAIKRAGIKRENGTNEVHPFKAALSKPGVSFICEVKKASPSKGLIAPDFPYVEIARQYQEAGADAVSVLTEPEFFLGADRYLEEIHREIELPLLRKDFIVDEYQIYEAKVLGASAVLLICSLMDMEKLKRYMGICGSLGLSSLAEAHTDREVAMAAEAGADIIGINNRNLETFEVDFTNALRLRKLVDRGTIFVAESGIRTPEDIELLSENQVDAVLVGETLMRAPDKKRALRELKSRIG